MQQCVLRHSTEIPTTAEISHASLQYHSNISLHSYGFRQSTPKGWVGGGHIHKDFPLGQGYANIFCKGPDTDISGLFIPHIISVTKFFIKKKNHPLKYRNHFSSGTTQKPLIHKCVDSFSTERKTRVVKRLPTLRKTAPDSWVGEGYHGTLLLSRKNNEITLMKMEGPAGTFEALS